MTSPAVFSGSEAGRVDFLDTLGEPGHAGSCIAAVHAQIL
jgi:hypothetical protein